MGTEPTRRTQGERTAGTTARILDATIACLAELGFGATTITTVAERAGVSRGALLHHYPSKEALFLAAVEHVVDRRLGEFRGALGALPETTPPDTRVEVAIDAMWSIYRGPTMDAYLELTIASRSWVALRELLVVQSHRFDAQALAAWHELLPDDGAVPAGLGDTAPVLLHVLLKGLATDSLTRSRADADRRAEVTIASLKSMLRRIGAADPDLVADEVVRSGGANP